MPTAAAPRLRKGHDLFTTGEVARACGVSPRTATIWCDRGLLRHVRIPGSEDRRVYREDLIAFARDRGLKLAFDRPDRTVRVHCGGAGDVTEFDAGGLVALRQVCRVVVGCSQGYDTALALARAVRAADPLVALELVLPAYRPVADVPPGLFDTVTQEES